MMSRLNREAYKAYDQAAAQFHSLAEEIRAGGAAPKPDQARALALLSREVERWQARLRSYRPKRTRPSRTGPSRPAEARPGSRRAGPRLPEADGPTSSPSLAPGTDDEPTIETTSPEL